MTTARRAYNPRDVINAPEIKAGIAARSLERGDPPEIAAWLGNHFYRHVIGNFSAPAPAVARIKHWREMASKYPQDVPEWAQKAIERMQRQPADANNTKAWWIDPQSEPLLALEARLVEFLHSRTGTALEGKLQRINCPQALARWALEHLAFAQKRERGLFSHQPAAVNVVLSGEHGQFVEFDPKSPQLRMEMAYESQMMQHCLGQFADRSALTGGYGEHYAEACEQGRMRLFSYRSGNAHPHISVSAYVQSDGRLRIDQIKGKQNRPPVERYHADVLALLSQLETDEHTPEDALAIGLVRRPDTLCTDGAPAWCSARSELSDADHLWLLHAYPNLVAPSRLHTPLLQWLVAARRDKIPEHLFAQMPRSPALEDALQLAEAE